MPEIKDFESFYKIKLEPFLITLKTESNETAKWKTAGFAAIILSAVCFIVEQKFIGIIFIVLVLVSIYQYTNKKTLFIYSYKEKVIGEIIKYLNPGMVYNPAKYIASKDYKRSGLFRNRFENYDGSDFLKGEYKNVGFFCSELETSYDSLQDAPISQMKDLTIFKGLFFEAPVSNFFAGATYVWPRGKEQLARSVMDERYRLLPLPNVLHVAINNEMFDKEFSVYTTNTNEALTLIDEEMIQRLLHFKKQINREVRFSVVSGVCYVSIAINENLLEPSISEPDNKEMIKNYFFTILLIFSIITQLNLARLR